MVNLNAFGPLAITPDTIGQAGRIDSSPAVDQIEWKTSGICERWCGYDIQFFELVAHAAKTHDSV